MHRINCTQTGCNYPEGECAGTCLAGIERTGQERRQRDSLEAATWCVLGLLAIFFVGICINAGFWLVQALGVF